VTNCRVCIAKAPASPSVEASGCREKAARKGGAGFFFNPVDPVWPSAFEVVTGDKS
jgi:hypothetical protein